MFVLLYGEIQKLPTPLIGALSFIYPVVATGLVSFPLRYMHTPVEVFQLDDVENAIRLIVAFAQRLEPGVSFGR